MTSFTVFNLFIGVVVNAMQAEHEAEQIEKTGRPPVSLDDLMQELKKIRAELAEAKGEAGAQPAAGLARETT